MTPKQIAILNSLVTYAAENVSGGLSDDEREVAQLVGRWALGEAEAVQTHNYTVINVSLYGKAEDAANWFAKMGWRVVAGLGAQGPEYADQLILERPVGVTHPDD